MDQFEINVRAFLEAQKQLWSTPLPQRLSYELYKLISDWEIPGTITNSYESFIRNRYTYTNEYTENGSDVRLCTKEELVINSLKEEVYKLHRELKQYKLEK